MLIEIASEPFVTVEVDLNRKGEPCGDSHMHETKLRIDEVEVQAQTLTPGRDQAGPFRCRDKMEALAGFHRGQDADEPFGDPVGIRNGSGFFLFSDLPVEMDVRSPAVLSYGSGMLLTRSDCTLTNA